MVWHPILGEGNRVSLFSIERGRLQSGMELFSFVAACIAAYTPVPIIDTAVPTDIPRAFLSIVVWNDETEARQHS